MCILPYPEEKNYKKKTAMKAVSGLKSQKNLGVERRSG
jgi:hypothetical protein